PKNIRSHEGDIDEYARPPGRALQPLLNHQISKDSLDQQPRLYRSDVFQQAMGATHQTCDREIDNPFADQSGKSSFDVSRQSVCIQARFYCPFNEKARLTVGLQVTLAMRRTGRV
ncbi:MAG TPA: hypothetical protein VJS90_07850, partial [Pseudomonas sp.]|uniref:hypothetical protein n=1 Tax=Pseudomonas sp. TaxID=306 RepID=UPI002B49C5D2